MALVVLLQGRVGTVKKNILCTSTIQQVEKSEQIYSFNENIGDKKSTPINAYPFLSSLGQSHAANSFTTASCAG